MEHSPLHHRGFRGGCSVWYPRNQRYSTTAPQPIVNSTVVQDGEVLRVRDRKGPRRNTKLWTEERVAAERAAVARHALLTALQSSQRPLDVELLLRHNMASLEPMHVLQAQHQLIEVASVYHPNIGAALGAMEEAYLNTLPKFRPTHIASGLQSLAKINDYRPSPQLLKALVRQLLATRSGIQAPHVLTLLDFFSLKEYRNAELYGHLYHVAVSNLHVYTASELTTVLFGMSYQGEPPGPLDPVVTALRTHLDTWVDHPELKVLPDNKLFALRDAPKLLWTLSMWERQPRALQTLLLGLMVEAWDRVLPHYQLMGLSGALGLQRTCWPQVRGILQHVTEHLYVFKPAQLVELLEINLHPGSEEQRELLVALLRHLRHYADRFTADQMLCILKLSWEGREAGGTHAEELWGVLSTQLAAQATDNDVYHVEEVLTWQMECWRLDEELADKAAAAAGDKGRRRHLWEEVVRRLRADGKKDVADRVARKTAVSGGD